MNKPIVWIGALIMAATFLTSCTSHKDREPFKNSHIEYQSSTSNLLAILKAYWNDNRTQATPKVEIPVQTLTRQQLLDSSQDAVFRLGHSTLLLRIDGEFILLDPVFSERAFPVQWMGPKRFHHAPISIEELPQISAVIISHDHYDHLDKHAIKQLAEKTDKFVTPLKVGDHLLDWGVPRDKIIELDWWQHTQVNTLKITATPAQHFSGRGLFDRDQTLWASWVIQGWDSSIFFSGDSGYFDGFKQIGERLGPFDITLIETGAYHSLWSDIHMMPEQSLQAHIDLKGKVMLPIHNGTFDLALHDWFEPLERLQQLAHENDVQIRTPIFGAEVTIKQPLATTHWWRTVPHAAPDTLVSD